MAAERASQGALEIPMGWWDSQPSERGIRWADAFRYFSQHHAPTFEELVFPEQTNARVRLIGMGLADPIINDKMIHKHSIIYCGRRPNCPLPGPPKPLFAESIAFTPSTPLTIVSLARILASDG